MILGPCIFLLASLAICTRAFAPSSTSFVPQSSPSSSRLLKASPLDEEMQDLELARANFEFLMRTEGLIQDDVTLPLPHVAEEYTPRPLTESSRRRRQVEIDLIKSLEESDDAVEELMALWMVERGMEAAEALQEMETNCSPGLEKEEALLRDLLDEFGIHWVEPVSRLASLMYFKGNSAESDQWCEIALSVKPWHFEVVHTQVLNALRQQDLVKAIRLQRRCLPPLNPSTGNKARKGWVAQALKDAKLSLAKAEAAAAEKKNNKDTLRENEVWQ